MHVEKYIEMLDKEIDALMEKESKGLTSSGEDNLYILLENRKNAMKRTMMLHGHMEDTKMETSENPMNPRKSYFGGWDYGSK